MPFHNALSVTGKEMVKENRQVLLKDAFGKGSQLAQLGTSTKGRLVSMNNRSSVAVILAACLVLGLVAIVGEAALPWWCMSKDVTEWIDVSRYVEPPPYKVAWDIYFETNNFGKQFDREIVEEVKRHPLLISEFLHTASHGEVATQIANVEDMLVQDPDILILAPNSATALVPILEEAYEMGVVVIVCGAGLDSDNITMYVNEDDYEHGRVGAEWLAEQMGYEGNLVWLSGVPGVATAEVNWQAGQDVMAKYPGINIIAHEYGFWDYASTKPIFEDIVNAHPQIDGIWGFGGMTEAAIDVLREAGRPIPPCVDDGDNGFLKELATGDFAGLGVDKPVWLSQMALQLGLQVKLGLPTRKVHLVPPGLITIDNVKDFVRYDFPDNLYTTTHLPDAVLREIYGEQ
jgi:ribose transport system substrate-binding protein